jgi:hypothetical protein
MSQFIEVTDDIDKKCVININEIGLIEDTGFCRILYPIHVDYAPLQVKETYEELKAMIKKQEGEKQCNLPRGNPRGF